MSGMFGRPPSCAAGEVKTEPGPRLHVPAVQSPRFRANSIVPRSEASSSSAVSPESLHRGQELPVAASNRQAGTVVSLSLGWSLHRVIASEASQRLSAWHQCCSFVSPSSFVTRLFDYSFNILQQAGIAKVLRGSRDRNQIAMICIPPSLSIPWACRDCISVLD